MNTFLFSQRYKELIDFGNGEAKDNICGEISWQTKKRMVSLMCKFAEPQIVQPNRYDSYQISTNAFESAVSRFNNYIGYALFDADHFLSTNVFMGDAEEQLAARFSFAPHLFDLVELQYDELSEKEAAAFQGQLNTLLSDECVPWLLLDGKMIKIDAKQFEQDLKLKTLENMSMLKSNEPIFQAAFDELVRSFEFFEKSEYADAVLYAEKCYESTLKVVCKTEKGNADQLCHNYISNILVNNLPANMKAEGFKEKVMMSLPYIRNNTTAGHGAGARLKTISKPMANLAINLAATLTTFLVEQYSEGQISP